VGENLQWWLKKNPSWFTDYTKSTIPDWAVEDEVMLNRLRSKEVEEI